MKFENFCEKFKDIVKVTGAYEHCNIVLLTFGSGLYSVWKTHGFSDSDFHHGSANTVEKALRDLRGFDSTIARTEDLVSAEWRQNRRPLHLRIFEAAHYPADRVLYSADFEFCDFSDKESHALATEKAKQDRGQWPSLLTAENVCCLQSFAVSHKRIADYASQMRDFFLDKRPGTPALPRFKEKVLKAQACVWGSDLKPIEYWTLSLVLNKDVEKETLSRIFKASLYASFEGDALEAQSGSGRSGGALVLTSSTAALTAALYEAAYYVIKSAPNCAKITAAKKALSGLGDDDVVSELICEAFDGANLWSAMRKRINDGTQEYITDNTSTGSIRENFKKYIAKNKTRRKSLKRNLESKYADD